MTANSSDGVALRKIFDNVEATRPLSPEEQLSHRDESDMKVQRLRPDRRDQLVMTAMVLAAIGCGLLGAARPTAFPVASYIALGMFGALTSLAAVRADWRWLMLAAAMATVFADGAVAIGCGAAGFLLAAAVGQADQNRKRRRRVWQVAASASGGLAAISLTHLSDVAWSGTSTLLTVLVVLPLYWSGYRNSRRQTRRNIRRGLFVFCAFVVAAALPLMLVTMTAQDRAARAKDLASEALDLARAGDSPGASARFREAAEAFGETSDDLHQPWILPSLVVPGLAQNADAARRLADAGEGLSISAANALVNADYRSIEIIDGQVDLDALEAMIGPVDDANAALAKAATTIEGTNTTWLLPPVRGPHDEMRTKILDAQEEGSRAGQALGVAAPLLGGSGERRYFVAFTNPAETRSLGGFIGSYAILHATDGKVTVERDGDIQDLNANAAGRSFDDPLLADFANAEARWTPSLFFQNLTASPDPVTSALAIADQYAKAPGGTPIDGVFTVDPVGLAALLELTGPVTVDGIAEPLTKDNAAEFLMQRQYEEFGDLSNSERKDVLAEAGRATFDALTDRNLPGPATIGAALGPAVEEGHIRFVAFDPDESAFLARIGLTEPFGALPGHDVVSLRTSNSTGNKADVYLHRSLDYDVVIDRDAGTMEATATIELRNDVPEGLSRYVAGSNLTGTPEGTNTQYVQLYSTLASSGASLDGRDVGIEPGFELGLHAATARVDIARGQTRTLELHLSGPIPVVIEPDGSARYEIDLVRQPVVHADRVNVSVRDTHGVEYVTESFDQVTDRTISVPLD